MDLVERTGEKPVFSNLSMSIEERGGEFRLRSVVVNEGDARIQIAFNEPRPLKTTLRGRVLQDVTRYLESVDRPTGIWSFTGDRVVMQDLILSDPRLVVSQSLTDDAVRVFVLRFQRFFGQVTGMFDETVSIANPLRSQLDDLAFRTIESAIMPLFNISKFLESRSADVRDMPVGKLTEMLGDLQKKITNLHLHYLVLSQHLSGRPESRRRG
ncbi:hypothetical protein [Roseisalinus antarcticus]|uniref:Uncharacterized protein n=1 Tax=Roseisalinus antarcticus TaxID=254357 RepID=A0A1Y5T0R3_9RHOB|nr:hypothetical protein [Roseisalinus antarcticus]SLN49440.1 hypothetical protein ROA7023_02124 [Roseisalinus antarcticus]